MAERQRLSPKTFKKQVLEQGIPYERAGKRGMRFDPAVVKAYITVITPQEKTNVKAFPVSLKRKKSVITSERFAAA